MANSELESLQKELLYYTNLLKNHEPLKGQPQPSVQGKMAASWKQPTFPVHKIVKNTNPPLNSYKPQYSYNKLHTYKSNFYLVNPNKSNSYPVSPNKRTVLLNQNKYLKAESSAELSKQTTRSVQFPDNGFVNKRTVLHDNLVKKRRTVINSNNITDKALAASNTSEKVAPSDLQVLLKQMTALTQQLKKTSEKKSKIINLNIIEIKKDKHMVKESQNTVATNKNLSSSHKQVNNCNINSKKIVLKSSTHQFKNSMNKYRFEKNDIKPTLYSKTNKSPLKFEEKAQVINNSKQSLSGIKINVPNTSVPNRQNTVELKALMIDRRQAVDKKLNMDKYASNFKAVLKGSLSLSKVKSPAVLKVKSHAIDNFKSPIISREKRKYGSVYKKINKRQSVISSKNQFKTNSASHKTLAGTKMVMGNSKYKFVNKMNTLSSNEKLKLKNNSVSKENFLVPIDESDHFFKLLHTNSDIDKLEQNLLKITSSLTNTPKQPVTKKQLSNNKIYQCSTKKVNSKFCLKKTPLKKSKILASKYKFVNKTLQLSQNYVKTKNTSFKPSVKKLNKVVSKFSVVNKHPKSILVSPSVSKVNSVLVKRLYKSKSTIINKNDSPTSQSAKIIKSKYLSLIKRKPSSWQKHILNPKMPLRQQKFKGHFVTRRHSRQNQYKKFRNLYHPRGARRFSNYGTSIINKPYSKNFSKSMYQKRKYGCVQKPVRVIRGVRYSLSSSGKQLRKLPTRGQTQIRKIPKRVVIAGKSYIRTSENVMKTTSPTNLASRVLHRSINRVLIASTKKNLTKVNTYCMFYNRFGRCNRGVKCTYIHDPSKIAVCTRFLRGTCKIDGCPFSHEVAPGKMAICSFFLVDACEKDDCPYRHEKLSPDAKLCKAFVQGYCPNGKGCNKAHILICPKFIQGECEKGSSCAFPHPPPKDKRTVQKEIVGDKEVEKPDDALLENVARYFQPLFEEPLLQCQNTTVRNDTVSLFVPQRRRLEEQPSFIPLCNTPVTPKNFQPGILGE